jgi:hypothetical protein
MKKLYSLFFITFIYLSVSAQFKIATSYSLSIPQGKMGDNIGLLHSLNGTFLYPLPHTGKRLIVGAELGIGDYASVSKKQDLHFPDGSGINTNVNYSSSVFNSSLLTRFNFLKDKQWSPYVNIKGGYAQFFSSVTVDDPTDPSSCRALERKNLLRDHTFFVAYGGGLQFDLSCFSKRARPGRHQIDITVNIVSGGKVNYINTKHIQSDMQTDPNNPMPSTGKSQPLNIRFINISTQTIHEHQVAELFNSPLRMLDIKIGMIFQLGE